MPGSEIQTKILTGQLHEASTRLLDSLAKFDGLCFTEFERLSSKAQHC